MQLNELRTRTSVGEGIEYIDMYSSCLLDEVSN